MIFGPVTHSLFECPDTYSDKVGGIIDNHTFAIASHPNIGGPVSILRMSSGPMAVLRSIVTVIVDTFKRKAGWGFAHVSHEVLKLQPPFANSNTSAAVPMIVRVGWSQTPRFHIGPHAIGWRYAAAPRASVFQRLALHRSNPARIGTVFTCAFLKVARECVESFSAMLAGTLNSHKFTSIMVSNHWRMPGIKVIDVLSSAAKPIRATVFYHA